MTSGTAAASRLLLLPQPSRLPRPVSAEPAIAPRSLGSSGEPVSIACSSFFDLFRKRTAPPQLRSPLCSGLLVSAGSSHAGERGEGLSGE